MTLDSHFGVNKARLGTDIPVQFTSNSFIGDLRPGRHPLIDQRPDMLGALTLGHTRYNHASPAFGTGRLAVTAVTEQLITNTAGGEQTVIGPTTNLGLEAAKTTPGTGRSDSGNGPDQPSYSTERSGNDREREHIVANHVSDHGENTRSVIEAYEAKNLGDFPMSQELVGASKSTLISIYKEILAAGNIDSLSINEALGRLSGHDNLSERLIASFLMTVKQHAISLDIPWFQINNSPLVIISAGLNMRKREEEVGQHVDFQSYPNSGMRFLLVNHDPTLIDGIPDLKEGEIATTVHGRTLHSAPFITASSNKPRLRITADFFLDDPRVR